MPRKTALIPALAACTMLGLTSCSGYDVELNGGLFDVIGASNLGKPKPEPKMAKRSGIVMPPTTASLPVPGSGQRTQPTAVASVNGDQSWPVDPEALKAKNKQAALDQHLAFCEKARQRHEAGIDAVLASGPLGACEKSILKNLTGKRLFENNRPTAKQLANQPEIKQR